MLAFNYNQRVLEVSYNFEAAYAEAQESEVRVAGDVPADGIMRYARLGLQALVESTRAFHGLEGRRFVVANIFGTAHV